jgi:hypothetical protein
MVVYNEISETLVVDTKKIRALFYLLPFYRFVRDNDSHPTPTPA